MIGAARIVVAGACLIGSAAGAFAQLPPDPNAAGRQGRRGLPPAAAKALPPATGNLTNEEVYELLDAFVLGRAQGALQLNDGQLGAFFQRMKRLQRLQAQHRHQRNRLIMELRQLVGPRAPQGTEDVAIATKTKELDDAEAQMAQDERKALADIDEVLQIRQRAHFRLFLDAMEKQKLELLIRVRQGPVVPAPQPAVPPGGRGTR